MNCYHHHDLPAVGICKSCNKGLCHACAVDVGNGLACKNSCEAEVRALNDVLERNKSAYQKTGKAYQRNAFVYGLMGFIFLLLGILEMVLMEKAGIAFVFIPFGLIFIIAGLLSIRSSRQISNVTS